SLEGGATTSAFQSRVPRRSIPPKRRTFRVRDRWSGSCDRGATGHLDSPGGSPVKTTTLRPPISSLPRTARFKALLGPALVLGAASLLVPACGSSGQSGVAACSIGGVACPVGCMAGAGCGQCGTAADCSPSQPFCVNGGCVACQADTDCAVGQACWPR